MGKVLILIFHILLFVNEARSQHNTAVTSNNSTNSNPFYSSLSTFNRSYADIIGSPFLEEKWVDGKIRLRSGEYDNLKLKLDLLNDELFVKLPKGDSFIVERSLVSEFKLLDGPNNLRVFKNLQFNDEEKRRHFGFFEILYEGKTQFLVKRLKIFREADGKSTYLNGTSSHELKSDKMYFIKKSDKYYKITLTQKSIISVLGEFEGELRIFMKDNGITLRREKDLAILLKYYDSMLKN